MTHDELIKLAEYLECNDASMESQCEAATQLRKLAQIEKEKHVLKLWFAMRRPDGQIVMFTTRHTIPEGWPILGSIELKPDA